MRRTLLVLSFAAALSTSIGAFAAAPAAGVASAPAAKVASLKCKKGFDVATAVSVKKVPGGNAVSYKTKSGHGDMGMTDSDLAKRSVVTGGQFCLESDSAGIRAT